MHQLIASPFLGEYLVTRPDSERGVKIPQGRYRQLKSAEAGELVPEWLEQAVAQCWGLNVSGRALSDVVLIRSESAHGFGRASYELNLGCNYDCEHCYLGLKRFEGLCWSDRERLLHIMRDAGVLWLQLTGGEPLIDRLFSETYELAWDLGMMIGISSNGSRLHNPDILNLLTTRRPYRLTISVYGATEASYDGLTRRRGSFRKFQSGLAAAVEAGLPLKLNIVVARQNEHEVAEMQAMAEGLGIPYHVFTNMSPTIYGGPESLPAQSREFQRQRKPFGGCNAGVTFFHADPHGVASICKVGRDPSVNLMSEGVAGLTNLAGIAEKLQTRTGGCSGCTLSGTCWVCRPLAKLYQQAKAPLGSYCQHRGR
ncbi:MULTISPECIES: radical SAM protein [unclassified Amycolatopsis]|uniref:radical SAM protein n=1 Tax=unclassified Amycolatopsis TaxID=2618356 RepID=UPI001C6996D9|nr:radical SAM protein [Amycolatopsis sp. DSM 110486]QYN20173.1 radical SAM protein [Amycolatopsis sp. DSM 110486]